MDHEPIICTSLQPHHILLHYCPEKVTFLVPAYYGCRAKRAVKRAVFLMAINIIKPHRLQAVHRCRCGRLPQMSHGAVCWSHGWVSLARDGWPDLDAIWRYRLVWVDPTNLVLSGLGPNPPREGELLRDRDKCWPVVTTCIRLPQALRSARVRWRSEFAAL